MSSRSDLNLLSPFAGMAIKQVKENKGIPDTFLGIPLQVGPGSKNAQLLSHWLWTAVGAQAIVCILQIVCISDITGALEMALTAAVGYWAVTENMNITYTCLWGALCLLFGVLGVIALILPLLESVLTLDVLSIVIQSCVPIVYLFGALLAAHLYHVWAQAQHMPDIPTAFDPLGKFVDSHDPLDYQSTGKAALGEAKTLADEYTPLIQEKLFSGGDTKKSGCAQKMACA